MERHSLRLRNQVSCRLANRRVCVFDQFDGGRQIPFTLDVLDHLAIAHRLGRRLAQRAILGQEAADFLNQTGREHRLDPPVDPLMEFVSRPIEYENAAFVGSSPRVELLLQLADGSARLLENLQRPNQSSRVVGMEPLGRDGVDLGQASVQRLGALPLGLLAEPLSKLQVGRRDP